MYIPGCGYLNKKGKGELVPGTVILAGDWSLWYKGSYQNSHHLMPFFPIPAEKEWEKMETHLQPGRGQGPAWAESFLSLLFHLDGRMHVLGLSWQQGAPCSYASQWSWEEAASGKHRASGASLLCPKFRLPAGAHGTQPGRPLPWIRAWLASGLDHRIYLATPPEVLWCL